ncbi:SDR family NAD(P)-dependent oxidoreductase [Streptomyces sp. NPDC004311]|uniref:SDR family NAD(P)-dependent oxidoreductase n=1 Tax=Streptomyces sp. NPDC004311 TaxID=3364698 RepID=UPI0036BA1AAD
MTGSSPRVLVVGATGELGTLAVHELLARGAKAAVCGRDPDRLAGLAANTGCPARHIDAYDLDDCGSAAPWAAAALGGLDGVLTTVGVAAFGPAATVTDDVAEHLMTVNALCPMAVLRGAVSTVEDGGFLAAVTGAIVDTPLTGTADYAAAKSALSCWLGVVARELRRRRVAVVDARLPHMDTGFATRAVLGSPPPLARGADPARETAVLVDRLLGLLPGAPPGPPS